MFRALIPPIFRSTILCVTAYGRIHPRCCRPADRQHLGCILPQAVTRTIVLLKMGGINSRNILSWLELLINRYSCIWLFISFISSCVRGQKWQEDEEEDVGSYWMTSRKGDVTLIWKRKLLIPLYRKLALKEVLDLSKDRLQNEWNNDTCPCLTMCDLGTSPSRHLCRQFGCSIYL